MSKVKILHNKMCSKSCTAMNFLKDHGFSDADIDVNLYVENGIDTATAQLIVDTFEGNLEDLIRKPDAKKLEIEVPSPLTKEWIVENIVKTPKIMQRPIIIKDGKAIIGRSEESLGMLI
ncbi:MAG TPA: ArsC/Spx/MgsR family protein [Taishania sp.]|nr:ArsC/Spx/MgsR family protein [Taishania sp.]HNS41365.1 ArsC/Spx/MgsR family protein [Taishania sp.]